MTETARTYAIVLYELGIPEEMVREAVKLLKENPELPEVLNSPVVPPVSYTHLDVYKRQGFKLCD